MARDASPPADTGQPVASGVPASASPLPAPVEAAGHYGEDAYDMVKAGDWTSARAIVDSLASAVARMTTASPTDAQSLADVHAAVQALDSAVVSRNRTTGMRAANRITELGARLAAGYQLQVPTGVTLLDYYGRELEIWSEAGDLAKLQSTSADIRRTWNALRPQVVARGGQTEAAGFETLVSRAEAASTPAAFAAVATPILDAVDGLEKVFTR